MALQEASGSLMGSYGLSSDPSLGSRDGLSSWTLAFGHTMV